MGNEYLFYTFYTIIVITSFLLIFYEDKYTVYSKKSIICILMFFLAMLSAMRPDTIPDTENYIRFFNSYIDINEVLEMGFSIGKRYTGYDFVTTEPGFIILIYIFRKVINSQTIFFGVISFFVSYSVTFSLCNIYGYLIKEEKRLPIFTIWTCFLLSYGLHYTSVAIRAGISIGIGLLAINLFIKSKNKILKFAICPLLIILSSMIQTFGILFFLVLMILVSGIGIDKRVYLSISILGILLSWFIFNDQKTIDRLIVFFNYIRGILHISAFSSYIYGYEMILTKQDIYRVVVTFILIYLSIDDSKKIKNIVLISFVGLIILIVAYPFPAIGRAADYFLIFSILIFANSVHNRKYMTDQKLIYLILLLALYPSQMAMLLFQ